MTKLISVDVRRLHEAIDDALREMKADECEGFDMHIGKAAGLKFILTAEPDRDHFACDSIELKGNMFRCLEERESLPTVFVDTETTGFNPDEDEILEIAIVDSEGRTLLNSLVRPEKKTAWPEAQAVNGITPEMVASAPTLDELELQIKAALKRCRVVAYNMAFDLGFLKPTLAGWIPGLDFHPHCAMRRFSVMRGVWDEKKGDYKRWKQVDAAEFVHHHRHGVAHRALADAMACRSVWQWLEHEGVRV